MKTNLIFLGLMLAGLIAFSQSPAGFNYQAVVRNAGGEVLYNSNVGMQISIVEDLAGGIVAYREIHNVQTNEFGLINLVIGQGTPVTGTFADIAWGEGLYYLHVGLDVGGTGIYEIMGISQLWSVPYSKYADSAGNVVFSDTSAVNELQQLSRVGDEVFLSKDGGSASINDADADPTNEIQTLTKTGNLVELSSGGGSFTDETEDADADPANETNLSLSLSGNDLTITDAGGSLTAPVAAVAPSADGQVLTWNGATQQWEAQSVSGDGWGSEVAVADGVTVTGDGTSANPLTGNYQGGTGILVDNIAGTIENTGDDDADPMNEIQTLTKTGNLVELSNDGGSFTDETEDADADPANETNLSLSLSGNDLTITDAGGSLTAPVAAVAPSADGQVLTWNGATQQWEAQSMSGDGWGSEVAAADGVTVTGDGTSANPLTGNYQGGTGILVDNIAGTIENTGDADADPMNEIQTLTKTGNLVELSNGGGAFVDETDDADADPMNEIQTLTKTGNLVELSNGGGAFVDDTEDADADPNNEINSGLSVQGNEIMITDAGGPLMAPIAAVYPSSEGQVLTWNNTAMQWEAKTPAAGGSGWDLTGNSGTIDGFNFLGTTDNAPVNFRVNNYKAGRIAPNGEVFLGVRAGENNTNNEITGIGYNSLFSNTSGARNTALGYQTLYTNTTGNNNTATGYQSLFSNTAGFSNTANGYQAAYSNTDGIYNSAFGYRALYNNTTGYNNSAIGFQALAGNTTGNDNTAVGVWALWNNTTGSQNIAVGGGALENNTTGANNTATGMQALYANVDGNYNSAFGYLSLSHNCSGGANSALGGQALYSNTTGSNNTATGYSSLMENTVGSNNSAYGVQSLEDNTTGSNNSALGYRTLFNNSIGNDNSAFGYGSLYENTTGSYNVATGYETLYANTTGLYNSASGYRALQSNTTGNYNTAYGAHALQNSTTGIANVAVGYEALNKNTTGHDNAAIGSQTMVANTTGSLNTAVGEWAMHYNSTASSNTAIGFKASYANSVGEYNVSVGALSREYSSVGNYNTAIGGKSLRLSDGNENTAVGYESLYSHSLGDYNTAFGAYSLRNSSYGIANAAFGYQSLYSLINGTDNSAFGSQSLYSITTGSNNSAFGEWSLFYNTTGVNNSAFGFSSLYDNHDGDFNLAVGSYSLSSNTTGDLNTAVGWACNPYSEVFSNTTALGAGTSITASNQVRLGNSSVTSIGGQVGWTTLSDERAKSNIQENVKGLDFIMELRPVTYFYDIDKQNQLFGITHDTLTWDGKNNISQMQMTGFLAQEVEVAAQKTGYNFSGVDNSGGIYGLRYAEFTVPLVKAVQEQQGIINDLKSELNDLKTRLVALESKMNNK